MQPASRILTYLLAALAIPGLPFFMLALLLLPPLILLIRLGRNPLGLVWRTRWLLLVLALGYAWGLPGVPLLPAVGDLSPSLEGFLHGARQSVGLLVLLLWLDVLVLALSPDDLLGGIYQLARPLGAMGLDRGRLALRLGLTLKAIEGLERGRGNLLRLLDPRVALDLPGEVRLTMPPPRGLDFLLPAVLLAGLLLQWFSA